MPHKKCEYESTRHQMRLGKQHFVWRLHHSFIADVTTKAAISSRHESIASHRARSLQNSVFSHLYTELIVIFFGFPEKAQFLVML